MDGRGGCCIARYGGGGAAAYDMSKIDRIMLRFRPIAPKPAASGPVSGGSKAAEGESRYVKTGRGRRRRRSNSKNNNKSSCSSGSDDNSGGSRRCKKRKSASSEVSMEKLSSKGVVQDNTVVTLPLLPEAPDLTVTKKGQKMPMWLSFDGSNNNKMYGKEVDEYYGYPAVRGSEGDGQVGMWTRKQRVVVGSWVIVECVTDTWMEEEGMMLGMTDEEKKRSLEEDTCPGLISDCWNRVWWTNKAYRKMAREGCGRREHNTTPFEGKEEEHEVVAWLVMKEKVPATCQAFTCRVRVQSTWNQQEGREKVSSTSTATLPCDVWRMSNGGFAWRLDVKAALSLGR